MVYPFAYLKKYITSIQLRVEVLQFRDKWSVMGQLISVHWYHSTLMVNKCRRALDSNITHANRI